MYSEGRGVPQDYGETFKWYRKAAEQGFAGSQNNLGFMYGHGEGVPQDHAEAVKWYREAANQGFARAQSNLGIMYLVGRGVPQDYMQAHMWSSLAVSRIPPGRDRDDAVKRRDIAAIYMTPAQIAEAERLAREWTAKQK